MKERPALFSGEMVRAILEDRKGQTRRVMSPQPIWHGEWGTTGYEWKDKAFTDSEFRKMIVRFCPYGKPGDQLWVRETFYSESPETIHYRADGFEYDDGGAGWRPSIFMPRWASRITLEITGVRVERLQEISEEDAIAEGCTAGYMVSLPNANAWKSPNENYRDLWNKINGEKHPWDSNPFVWVIEFKRVK